MTEQRQTNLAITARSNSVGAWSFPQSGYLFWGKRALDIALSVLFLPYVAPFVCLIWMALRIQGGSGFYSQNRVGKNGKIFRCWKLRTMVPNAEEILKECLDRNSEMREEWLRDQKLSNDPRITRFGRILRQTSMDELPQFWNVLKGDMSFVGPRPVLPEELARYGTSEKWYKLSRPGITGLWQVSGRNNTTYEERVALDVSYAKNVSLLLDLKILALTPLEVFRRSGR